MTAAFLSPKLAVLLAGGLVYLAVRRTYPERSQHVIAALLLSAVLRDLAYAVLGLYPLLVIGDIGLLLGLAYWLRAAGGRGGLWFRPGIGYLLLVLGVVLLEVTTPGVPRMVYLVPLVGAVAGLIGWFYDAVSDSVENARIIGEARAPVCLGVFYGQAALAVLGHHSAIAQLVIYPLFYLIPVVVLLRYFELGRQRSIEQMRATRLENESLFAFMRRVAGSFGDRVELESTLNVILASAMEDTAADGGSVWLLDGSSQTLSVRAVEGVFPPPHEVPEAVKKKAQTFESYLRSLSIRVGETAIGQAVQDRVAIYVADTTADPRFRANSDRDDLLFISSFVALPLVIGERVRGVLALVKRRPGIRFSERDFEHLRTFADYAALTIELVATYLELLEKREVERELAVAASIQRQMVPERLPGSARAEFSAYALAARGVGGDYYDVFELDERRVAAIVCDVAGKGVPAALVMVMVRTAIRLIASAERDSGETLGLMNEALAQQMEVGHYATIGFFIYDSDKQVLQYSNAAHHPVLVYHRDRDELLEYDTEGLPVGIERGVQYPTREISVMSDDLVVMYTDGLTEARNNRGEQFEARRVFDTVARSARAGSFGGAADRGVAGNEAPGPACAQDIRDALRDELTRFVGGARQHDDQTVLVMRVR